MRIEKEEVVYRWQKGMSQRNIAKTVGMSRTTVRKLITHIKAHTGGQEEGEAGENLFYEEKPSSLFASPVQASLASHHTHIEGWIGEAYMTVTQMVRLLKERGKDVSESSLRRYVQKHFPKAPKSTVHLETVAGRQAQVDFGYVGYMYDAVEQKRRKAYAFVMTLSHSRYRFVRFVFDQKSATWIDCHIRAFHFFGGIPETVMLDNLKTGVVKSDIYDPIIHRAYGELEKHYGFMSDPTKVRTPQHKGKVERTIQTLRQQILAGRVFEESEAANKAALHWCQHEIAHRPCRTTGRTPWDLFIAEEKKALLPLPKEDYECALWQELKVHRDHHIVFEKSYYSVPTSYIGKKVGVRATRRMIEIYWEHRPIKTHIRADRPGQWVTDKQDYPLGANAFLGKDPAYCLQEARKAGPSVYAVIQQTLEGKTRTGERKAQAILRLGEQYGVVRLEASCQRALAFETTQYRNIKGILHRKCDEGAKAEESLPVMPSHTYYNRGSHTLYPIAIGGVL